MQYLEQESHVLVGVHKEPGAQVIPGMFDITSPKVVRTDDDVVSEGGGDSPPVVLPPLASDSGDSSDPYLEDDEEDGQYTVFESTDDEYSNSPNGTLLEYWEDDCIIEEPTTMSLDLLEDIKPADVAVKISDSPHYERLAPLPSYNDNESIKIERPEMPVTVLILRHKMRSGGSYKLRLPGMELKHRIKHGEIKESRPWNEPWNTHPTPAKSSQAQKQRSQRPQGRHSPRNNPISNNGILPHTRENGRVRPTLPPISIPRNVRPSIQIVTSPATPFNPEYGGASPLPSPRTPCFPHSRSNTMPTPSSFPSPVPPYPTPTHAWGGRYSTVPGFQPISREQSPYASSARKEQKLFLRPPDYTVLHPSPRTPSHISSLDIPDLRLPPTPTSPTPQSHTLFGCDASILGTGNPRPMGTSSLPVTPNLNLNASWHIPTPAATPHVERHFGIGTAPQSSLGTSPCARLFVPCGVWPMGTGDEREGVDVFGKPNQPCVDQTSSVHSTCRVGFGQGQQGHVPSLGNGNGNGNGISNGNNGRVYSGLGGQDRQVLAETQERVVFDPFGSWTNSLCSVSGTTSGNGFAKNARVDGMMKMGAELAPPWPPFVRSRA